MKPLPLLGAALALAAVLGAASGAPQELRAAYAWDVVVRHGKDRTEKASGAAMPGETAVLRLGSETAYVASFDARASVFEGCTLRLCGRAMPGDLDAVAVAFDVSEAHLAGPARKREIRPAKDADPVTIELPRVDTMQVAGGRVLRLGRPVELATLRRGDAWISFQATVTCRGDAVGESRPDELAALAEIVTLGGPAERTLVVELAARSEGTSRGFVCGTDARAPMAAPQAKAWTVVGALETTSIVGPGFRLRHGDDLAFVKSLTLDADGRVKPEIVTVRGGVTLTAATPASLHASWTELSYWGPRKVELAPGFAQEADRVETNEDANDFTPAGSAFPSNVRLTVADRRTQ